MNLRQLKKRDKRAAAILLTLYPHNVSSKGFGPTDDGRYSYEWRCSYEYDEWECVPALEYLEHQEDQAYMGECIDSNGDYLPVSYCPPYPVSAMKRLPPCYRWRGRRVVPVDKHGAMVRQGGAS